MRDGAARDGVAFSLGRDTAYHAVRAEQRRPGDQVQAAVDIPLLHLADATARAVSQAGLSTVGLLGTGFSTEQAFYRESLASHGLTVLVPRPEDRSEVHRVIYDELCLGVLREKSRQIYRDVIMRVIAAQRAPSWVAPGSSC